MYSSPLRIHGICTKERKMLNLSKTIIGLWAILLVSCASPTTENQSSESVVSSEQEQTTVAANDDDQYDPDEMICRREMVTGSNFRKRVCLTRGQRDGMRQGSREEFNTRRSGTLGGAAPGGLAQ